MSRFSRAQIGIWGLFVAPSRTNWVVAALASSALATLTSAAPAFAQSAQQTVEDLNRGAMEAYNNMDINKAGSMLEEALRVSAQGVTPQLLAQTNLNLGVVYVGGLGDAENGMKYFADALCADPSAQLDPLTSTPDIQNAFQAAQQKAQAGGCPAKGAGPGNPAIGPVQVPTQVVTHFSPPEQLTQTPLPLYAEVSPAARAKTVNLYYKGTGMAQWKKVAMQRYGQGYAFQISCNDVFEPQVQYYIEAVGGTGNVVGSAGTASEPVTVPVVSARTQAEPALPGAAPPSSCAATECPPGVKGCGESGTGAIGDSCSEDKDCQSGLRCDSDACVLRGARSNGDYSGDDNELPPGWGDEESDDDDAKGFKRGFFQLGLAVGMTYVQSGMIADRAPPNDRVFVDSRLGGSQQYVADPFDESQLPSDRFLFAGSREVLDPNDPTGTMTIIETDERTETAWVPDADSNDSIGALGGECAADGIETGPDINRFDNRLPSRYCVRVKSPGFVPGLALRTALGYFVTERISLALLMRFQFSAGEGTFSHMLLGARGEYMFSKPKPKGLMISMFLGGTFGQIQAKPPATGNTGDAPFIKSGLQGGHIGANFRYRIHKNFGFYMAPELDLQFPTFLWNIDFTFAGLEASF